jgi:hypothetical protein
MADSRANEQPCPPGLHSRPSPAGNNFELAASQVAMAPAQAVPTAACYLEAEVSRSWPAPIEHNKGRPPFASTSPELAGIGGPGRIGRAHNN